MKLSRSLLGTFALAFIGCTGQVSFQYVLVVNADDNGDGLLDVANSCDEVGVSDVRFMVGDDFNFDGILDNNEIQDEVTTICNQLDDGDGNLDVTEFGEFNGIFFAGSYDLFAVEFLDVAGNPVGWQTFDTAQNFTRFSFAGGFNVFTGDINIPIFAGDNNPNNIPDQFDTELAAFMGF